MANDETYILDLCDDVLGRRSVRHCRFRQQRDQEDPGSSVAAFYPNLKIAIDFRTKKSVEDERLVRAFYDEGVTLVIIDKRIFAMNDVGRLRRDLDEDREIAQGLLENLPRS